MNLFKNKARKGFSLVELVVVIIIIAVLAVAVFAGGSTVIKKSQVSRTVSDLHNFSVAAESTLNENPSVANAGEVGLTDHATILAKLNENLPQEYQIKTTKVTDDQAAGTNLKLLNGATWEVYESAKTDAWGNPYYVILDYGERHSTGTSDYYITVVSAGPNAQTNVGKNIECDDVFLLVQYTDGDVAAATYDVSSDKVRTTWLAADENTDATDAKSTDLTIIEHAFNRVNAVGAAGFGKLINNAAKTATTIKGTDGYLLYSGGVHSNGYIGGVLPVNF